MHLDIPTDVEFPAAAALTRDLPRDQALGLRLMAMARAAAGVHMGRVAMGGALDVSAGIGIAAQEAAADGGSGPQVLRTQAERLLELVRNHGRGVRDARATEDAMEGA